MENSGSDAGENRVAALEKRINGVGVLVGKFTEELLDLKAITKEMSRLTGEHYLKDPGSSQDAGAHVPDADDGSALPSQQDSTFITAAEPHAEDTAPDKPLMVMIMQTDGTMKLEPRRGNNNCLSAPVGYGVSGGSAKSRKGIHILPGQSRLT